MGAGTSHEGVGWGAGTSHEGVGCVLVPVMRVLGGVLVPVMRVLGRVLVPVMRVLGGVLSPVMRARMREGFELNGGKDSDNSVAIVINGGNDILKVDGLLYLPKDRV